jgi:steroid delta-isomerase-like uncharacterized protein
MIVRTELSKSELAMNTTPDAVMRTWFEEVWNQGREDAIDRLFAADGVVHGLPTADGAEPRGPEQLKPFVRSLRGAFPDIHIRVTRTVTEGDMIAVHCHVTGTHRGDSLGVNATGRQVDFWGMCIGTIRDGQIAEGWNSFDFLVMYQQIGLVPTL